MLYSNGAFQRAKEERWLLKILRNTLHSWIGHIFRHKEFVVNILEGAISGGIKGRGMTSTTIIKASRQKQRSWQLYSNDKNGLQQFQKESCQQIKRLKSKKKNKNRNAIPILKYRKLKSSVTGYIK